jgi:hypothetical protein
MIRAYLYRGAHRAGRFSVRVADIARRLHRERMTWSEYVDDEGQHWFTVPVACFYRPGAMADEGHFIAVAPPPGRAALPALVEVGDA